MTPKTMIATVLIGLAIGTAILMFGRDFIGWMLTLDAGVRVVLGLSVAFLAGFIARGEVARDAMRRMDRRYASLLRAAMESEEKWRGPWGEPERAWADEVERAFMLEEQRGDDDG